MSYARKIARKNKPHEAKRAKRYWNNLREFQLYNRSNPDWYGAMKSMEHFHGGASPALPNF